MIAIGPSPYSTGLCDMTCFNVGKRYESVFPDPVSAIPITSLPDMIRGKVCA